MLASLTLAVMVFDGLLANMVWPQQLSEGLYRWLCRVRTLLRLYQKGCRANTVRCQQGD